MRSIFNLLKRSAAFLLLMPLLSNAADRIVEENGAGGAYTSIKAALVGIPANTRILVFPRGGDNPYVETDTVAATGTRILSAVRGQRFRFKGTIFVSGTGVYISAAVVDGNITYSGDALSVAGCTVHGKINPTINSGNKSTFIDNDSIVFNGTGNYQSALIIFKGRVSGCYIENLRNYGQGLYVSYSGTATIDTVIVVGNHFKGDSAGIGLYINTNSQYYYVANNYFEVTHSCAAIEILDSKYSATVKNDVINNTINEGPVSLPYPTSAVYLGPNNNFNNLEILNSVYMTVNTNSYFLSDQLAPNTLFQYNYSSTALDYSGIADATNHAHAVNTIDIATGQLQAGSAGIDAGSPGNNYLDLDLTRNDAGCYGGSYTRANFTTAETGARVLYMRAPRVVMLNQSFSISGDGLAK